jgi:O-acetyl-ADP-ribose deacetylase (regulator of RNase III)
MKIVCGDLIELALEDQFDVIVHGCNCFCTMGSGIAKSIKSIFPEAYTADLYTLVGDKSKLGTITFATIGNLIVVNAYTQFDFGGIQPNVNYVALRSCFKIIKQKFTGKRIGYPAIGVGLAGGYWEIISEIIDQELEGEDHTYVQYYNRFN